MSLSVMLAAGGTASAANGERLHGTVLAVEARSGTAIVRHDAFSAMPSMTMEFRIVPRGRVTQLHAGETIDANVNRATDPWTLSNVTEVRPRAHADAGMPFRRVRRVAIGETAPAASFVDQQGKPFTLASLHGDDVILAFIYTRCQDARMCPLISAKFNALQKKIAGRKVHLVEVTLDPAYDRPAVLAKYGRTFGADPARWTLATGEPDAVLDFAAKFGIGAFQDAPTNIIHNEATVLIGPDGRVESILSETAWLPDELLAQIDAAHGRAANPLARFNLWLSSTAVALCGDSVAGFSGFTDLLVVLAIFGGFGYLMYRLARGIFKQPLL